MRHSDINLTMSRYTHIFRGQESKAVESLPVIWSPSAESREAVATGTDGDSAENLALVGGDKRLSANCNEQKADKTTISQNTL